MDEFSRNRSQSPAGKPKSRKNTFESAFRDLPLRVLKKLNAYQTFPENLILTNPSILV